MSTQIYTNALKDIFKLVGTFDDIIKLGTICKYYRTCLHPRQITIVNNHRDGLSLILDLFRYQLQYIQIPPQTVVPEIPDSFPVVETFYANQSFVPFVPEMPKATRVSFAGNLLDFIPDLLNAVDVDVRDNRLTFLPSLPNVVNLNCSDNILNIIPHMPTIRTLYCSANEIEALPDLSSVEILECAGNELLELPELPNVERLRCHQNQLIQLPQDLSKVIHLNCSSNHIPILHELPNAKFVDCSDNDIILLEGLPMVNILKCNINRVSELPYLPSVSALDISENHLITTLNGDNMPNVKYINARNTPLLETITGTFNNCVLFDVILTEINNDHELPQMNGLYITRDTHRYAELAGWLSPRLRVLVKVAPDRDEVLCLIKNLETNTYGPRGTFRNIQYASNDRLLFEILNQHTTNKSKSVEPFLSRYGEYEFFPVVVFTSLSNDTVITKDPFALSDVEVLQYINILSIVAPHVGTDVNDWLNDQFIERQL